MNGAGTGLYPLIVLLLLSLILILIVGRNKSTRPILIAPSNTCRPYNGRDTLLIPLSRDHNNIFLMDIKINNSWVKAAVDTGSTRLLVSGSDCVSCTKQGPISKVAYGSQSSKVRDEVADITLNTFRYQCNQNFESFPTAMPFASDKKCLTTQANVNVAMNFHGTSKYNIVGLNANSVFLRAMMPVSPRAFSIHVRQLHDASLLLYVPGMDCYVANHFLTMDRGLVQIQGLRLNGQAIEKGHARHVLVDTGANALSVPSPLYQAMPRRGKMSIELMSVEGKPFRLAFPYDKSDGFNAQVLETSGSSSRIIVGITFLAGYAVGSVQQGNMNYVTLDRL